MMTPDLAEQERTKMYADWTHDAGCRGDHARDGHWPAGWWLVPALIIGAGFWTMVLRALFALLF